MCHLGVGVLIFILPANVFGGKMGEIYQKRQMTSKDERMKLMSEIINGIKVLKMYAWEIPFMNQVTKIREGEIKTLRGLAKLRGIALFTWACSPFLVTLTVLATYVALHPKEFLTAEKVFVTMTLLEILKSPLNALPWAVVSASKFYVSLMRITTFLNAEEIDADK